jgi:hypothetical protein
MRRLILAVSVVLVVLLSMPLVTALAHDHRTIAGKYDVVVGWKGEPAFAGILNAASIRVTKTGTETAVEGLEKTLKVKIAFGGGEPKEFALRTVFGEPGHYVADIIPVRAGSYIFTFSGKIEDTDVNETFESGPGRFDDIHATDALTFPPVTAENAALTSALQDAANARTLAIVGIALGAIAVVLAGANLMRVKR